MVEHSTDNRKVAGSSPVIPTMYMKHVSEFGFKLPLVCKSRGVSSYIVETAGSNPAMLAYTPKHQKFLYTSVAQLAEQVTLNDEVAGSSPVGGTKFV